MNRITPFLTQTRLTTMVSPFEITHLTEISSKLDIPLIMKEQIFVLCPEFQQKSG